MTISSHVWKRAITKHKAIVEKLRQLHRWSDISATSFEESLIVLFYVILKMDNKHLLSKTIAHQRITMTEYSPRHNEVILFREAPLDKLYDLSHGKTVWHDHVFLCHQIIHNYILEPFSNKSEPVSGIYITSDHQHKTALYGIEMTVIIDLLNRITESNVEG